MFGQTDVQRWTRLLDEPDNLRSHELALTQRGERRNAAAGGLAVIEGQRPATFGRWPALLGEA